MVDKNLAKVFKKIIAECRDKEWGVQRTKAIVLQLLHACWKQRDRARGLELMVLQLQGELEDEQERRLDVEARLNHLMDLSGMRIDERL